MVRLKPVSKGVDNKIYIINLNSTMVRLKPKACSMITVLYIDLNSTMVRLKLHITVKGRRHTIFYLNSTMVRLKQSDFTGMKTGGIDLNSTMVRLKLPCKNKFKNTHGISIPLWFD